MKWKTFKISIHLNVFCSPKWMSFIRYFQISKWMIIWLTNIDVHDWTKKMILHLMEIWYYDVGIYTNRYRHPCNRYKNKRIPQTKLDKRIFKISMHPNVFCSLICIHSSICYWISTSFGMTSKKLWCTYCT